MLLIGSIWQCLSLVSVKVKNTASQDCPSENGSWDDMSHWISMGCPIGAVKKSRKSQGSPFVHHRQNVTMSQSK